MRTEIVFSPLEELEQKVISWIAQGVEIGVKKALEAMQQPEDPEELIKLEDVAAIIKRSIYTVRDRIKQKNKDGELIPVEQWPENKHYKAIRRKYIKDIDSKY